MEEGKNESPLKSEDEAPQSIPEAKPKKPLERKRFPSGSTLMGRAETMEMDHIERLKASLDMLLQSPNENDKRLLTKIREAKNAAELSVALPPLFEKLEQELDFLKYDQPGWDGNHLRGGAFVDMKKAFQRDCNQEAELIKVIVEHLQKNGNLRKEFEFKRQGTFDWESVLQDEGKMGHVALMVYDKRVDTKYPQLVIDGWIAPPGKSVATFHENMEKPIRPDGKDPALAPTLFYWIRGVNEYAKQEREQRSQFTSHFSPSDAHSQETAEKFLTDWCVKNKVEENGRIKDPETHDYLYIKYFADPNAEIRFAISELYFESLKAKFAYFLDNKNGGMLNEKEVTSLNECKDLNELQQYAALYYRKFYGNSALVQKIFGVEKKDR